MGRILALDTTVRLRGGGGNSRTAAIERVEEATNAVLEDITAELTRKSRDHIFNSQHQRIVTKYNRVSQHGQSATCFFVFLLFLVNNFIADSQMADRQFTRPSFHLLFCYFVCGEKSDFFGLLLDAAPLC